MKLRVALDLSGTGAMPSTSDRPLRADAARNREKLLAAAAEVFAERGLDAPLEDVARRAGVSIGTLYNRFPSREALLDAIFPERLGALDRLAAGALADDDPWRGFVTFVEGVFDLQARDRGLGDALSRHGAVTPEVAAACARGFAHVDRIVDRAKRAGRLRPDFEVADLAVLVCAMSRLVRDTSATAPDAWRRCLAFHLDGLRPEAAHPLPPPPNAEALTHLLPTTQK